MGHDPRKAGGLDGTKQSIALLSIAWLAFGHDGFFKNAGDDRARCYGGNSTESMVRPLTTSVCMKLTTLRPGLAWLVELTCGPERSCWSTVLSY
jgi:hypothetical protein